jgi:hypothetical protein
VETVGASIGLVVALPRGDRIMAPLLRVASIAVVVPIALASAVGVEPTVAASAPTRAPSLAPRVELQPSVARLGERATIAVSGIKVRSLEVRLAGGSYADGEALGWHSLRLVAGAWRGILPAPALRGVYPVVLRTRAGAVRIGPERLVLRVFARGTRTRPSFDDPNDVVRWWVRSVPHATLVAIKAWPRPAVDRRDVRLYRRFVVAYSPPGHPDVTAWLGMFVTAFRNGPGAGWRLLDATVLP